MTGSARRKKMLEIKEKRRAFKTFPHSLKAIPDNETSKVRNFHIHKLKA